MAELTTFVEEFFALINKIYDSILALIEKIKGTAAEETTVA